MENLGSVSPKEFLTAAEQKYGKNVARLIKLVMFGAGGLFLWLARPAILATLTTLTAIVGQAIVLAGVCGIAFALYMLFSSPMVRALISDHFDGFIRTLTKEGVKINPIDRLQAYASEYLQGRLDLVHSVQDKIRGARNWHLDQVEKKNAELAEAVRQAVFRKKRSCIDERAGQWKNDDEGREDREEFRLLSDQIQLLKDSLARFEKMGKRYDLFLLLLEKYERAFSLSIRKTQSTVQIVTDEFEASQNMAAATQAMSGVMEGTDTRTQLFSMTLEYVSQQIASNVAQVEGYFNRTRSLIATSDLQGDVAEDHLMAELSDMGTKTDKAIETLEAHEATSVQDMASRIRNVDSADVLSGVSASSPSGDDKYGDLLRKVRKN